MVIATGALLLTERPPTREAPVAPSAPPLPTLLPTRVAVQPLARVTVELLPTLDQAQRAVLLQQPPAPAQPTSALPQLMRNIYDPFTVIPERQRNGVIQYEIVKGDTVIGIGERFGLEPNTIAWSNKRSIIQKSAPGSRF